jgi:hypothetical protein
LEQYCRRIRRAEARSAGGHRSGTPVSSSVEAVRARVAKPRGILRARWDGGGDDDHAYNDRASKQQAEVSQLSGVRIVCARSKGNVGKTGGKIGKQAFERQEFFERWFGGARRRAFIARNSRFFGPQWLYFLPLSAPPSEAARRAILRRTARSMTFWHGYIVRMLR